jgi:hypothetical protein
MLLPDYLRQIAAVKTGVRKRRIEKGESPERTEKNYLFTSSPTAQTSRRGNAVVPFARSYAIGRTTPQRARRKRMAVARQPNP